MATEEAVAAAGSTPALAPETEPIWKNIEGIKEKLAEIKKEPKKHSYEEVHHLQQMLDAIDARREDGIFGGSLKSGAIPAGQAACLEALDEAYDLVGDIVPVVSDMNPDMTHIHDTLSGIKRKLLRLKANRDYTSDDVHHYQLMVDAIDNKRVAGIFAGDQQHIPAGQAQCSTLLFQVYELLHAMLASAPDMNAELRGIFMHLLGIKRKLIELKRTHAKHTSADLHIYQVQLAAVDNNRSADGIFGGSLQSGVVPAGQAVCATLLAQCYKLVQDLQETASDS